MLTPVSALSTFLSLPTNGIDTCKMFTTRQLEGSCTGTFTWNHNIRCSEYPPKTPCANSTGYIRALEGIAEADCMVRCGILDCVEED